MLAQHEIRRRSDGSLDIDFYREIGLMERRAVMSGAFKSVRKLGKPMVVVCVMAAALYLMPARDNTWTAPSTRDGLLAKLFTNGTTQF